MCILGGPSVPDIDGRWSQWTDWTVCNAPCGTGKQQRRRYCNSPRPSGNGQDCNGHGVEIRECNVHSCQGEELVLQLYSQPVPR